MKVLEYTVAGMVDRRQLTIRNIEQTRQEIKSEGLQFPTNEQLDFDHDSDWYLLLNGIGVHVLVEENRQKYWLDFSFMRGFIWDLASVPRLFRSLVDNDSQEAIIAAMVHDACFTGHLLPFRQSNSVFYGLLRESGASRIKARLYWLGVASPIGRLMYNKKTISRAVWQLPFVNMSISRYICCFRQKQINGKTV